MAITRCPYCHAIIDENDKYCNNCGTQLLFPEDEDVDEEIPGEKIIDAEVEEKDYTVDEPEDEKKPTDIIDLAEELDEELEEDGAEAALDKLVEEGAGGDEVTEEVILVDEIEAAETAAVKAAGKAETTGSMGEEEEKVDEEGEEDGKEEEEPEEEDEEGESEEKEGEKAGEAEPEEEEAKKYEDVPPLRTEGPTGETGEPPQPAAAEEEPEVEYITADTEREEAETAREGGGQPVTFDTRELEGMGKTVEMSKDKVDKFLEVLAEKRTEARPAAPPPGIREPSGTLPPWASVMKGAPVFAEESGRPATGEAESGAPAPASGEEEVEIFPRRRAASSTIGLPERVGQSPLPFDRAEEEAEAEEEEEEAERVGEAGEEPEGEAEEKTPPAAPSSLREREPLRPGREPERRPLEAEAALEEAEPRPPFSFAVFFKSKAFDFLFVGLFWLVALWLAAHSLGMTLFEILGAMTGSMFLLYVVFLSMYFFLFKFFLGETLGDRLFRERD